MSAYMVDREHIDLLVGVALQGPRRIATTPDSPIAMCFPIRWYARQWREARSYEEFQQSFRRLVPEGHAAHDECNRSPSQAGQLLVDANLTSIHARYPDTLDGGTCPGPIEPYWQEPYTWQRVAYRPSAVEALKAISCLDYQSCEYPDWPISEARRFLDALQTALIFCLPGYDQAPWTWDPDVLSTVRAATDQTRATFPPA